MKTYEELNGYVRVRKENARRLFNYGLDVYLVPCKVAFDFNNMWIKPTKVNSEERFDKFVNQFSYYNCQNAELGYYPHFWVKKEEVEKYDARRYK